MAELQPRELPSGANAFLEIHESPEGLTGVVAHWGNRLTMNEVHERLTLQGVEPKRLSTTTGFDEIYHQADNLERAAGIKDELTVADMIMEETLAANGWNPTDVDAVLLGSGVPVVDDPTMDNYAKIVAQRTGMRDDVVTHSTYAACTSGAHEFFRALQDPNLQGKNVVVLGMEGITPLTQNLDINYSDPFSIQVFSNGAAAIGMVPGQDIVLRSAKHIVFEDTVRALAARMTYERLLDQEDPNIWQEDDERGIHMIRYPIPEGDELIRLNDRTAMFFVDQVVPLVGEIFQDHMRQNPNRKIVNVASHHASGPVHPGLGKRLVRKNWIDPENLPPIPWVVKKGNSSAATTIIALDMMLPDARGGDNWMVVGYGAGGSADAGVIEFGARAA